MVMVWRLEISSTNNKTVLAMKKEYEFELNILDFNTVDFSKSLVQIVAHKFEIFDVLDCTWGNLIETILKRGKVLKNLILYNKHIITEKYPKEEAPFHVFFHNYRKTNQFKFRILIDTFYPERYQWDFIKGDLLHLGVIFYDEPPNFGLRGDPYLWNDLKEYFEDKPISKLEDDFIKQLLQEIESHLDAKLEDDKLIVVKKYKHGGMSSGGISANFWINSAIPMLISRYRRLKDFLADL